MKNNKLLHSDLIIQFKYKNYGVRGGNLDDVSGDGVSGGDLSNVLGLLPMLALL